MKEPLNTEGMNLLFREARTYYGWQQKTVSDETLQELYDLMKWAPTSMNCNPLRILFLRTREAKERLLPALAAGNVEKTMSAPVTAILGYDLNFHENMPTLFPSAPNARQMFASSPEIAEMTARRNSSLQGAYFMLAARALGLDCGPMSGFDQAKVDEEFFNAGQALDPSEQEFFTTGHIRTNFLCNIGYGDPAATFPRNTRFEFAEICKIL